MARLLIVEDDAAIAIALEDDLRLEGYEVSVAHNGEAALAAARATTFDLILLDIMLPRKDGFEVCRELRHSRVSSLILLLTARGAESDKVLGLELGADDYVTKPYSPRELRARVKALLRRGRAESMFDRPVQFGDCQLDPLRAELRRDGRLVPTTPLEFKLLMLFVQRSGRVMTRRLLIDDVWGKDTAITERVVDNQIANLRKKIEKTPATPRFLKSVKGIGYRFDLEDVTET
jgi:DNA-binding response OmpR family regulator